MDSESVGSPKLMVFASKCVYVCTPVCVHLYMHACGGHRWMLDALLKFSLFFETASLPVLDLSDQSRMTGPVPSQHWEHWNLLPSSACRWPWRLTLSPYALPTEPSPWLSPLPLFFLMVRSYVAKVGF